MGKTYYHKPWKTYCRSIKINGVTTFLCSPNKEYLEGLPFRLNSENKPTK